VKKGCFLITTYCENESKLKILKDCILNLKEKSNLDILLYNHHTIPESIEKLVNYSVYDYSNPIFKYPEKYLIVDDKIIDDYGYAALQQLKRGYFFLKNINYDFMIAINYDVIIDNFLINFIINKIETNNAILFYNYHNIIKLTLSCFCTYLDNIFNDITKEDYIKNAEDTYAEIYFQNIINKNDQISFHKVLAKDYIDHYKTSVNS